MRLVTSDDTIGFDFNGGKKLDGILKIPFRKIDSKAQDGFIQWHDGKEVKNKAYILQCSIRCN